MITGENGIINKTKESAQTHEIQALKEELYLEMAQAIIENDGNAVGLEEYIDYLTQKSVVSSAISEYDYVRITLDKYEFKVSQENGNIIIEYFGIPDNSIVTKTITYDPNGGSGKTRTQSVAEHSTVQLNFTNIPSKNGYVFVGWDESSTATDPTYTKNETKNLEMGSDNITLYAIWVFDGPSKPVLKGGNSETSWTYNPITISVDQESQDLNYGIKNYEYKVEDSTGNIIDSGDISEFSISSWNLLYDTDCNGYQVYLRSIDNIGLISDWSDPQGVFVDTAAPTISLPQGDTLSINSASTLTMSNVFTVTYGIGGANETTYSSTISGGTAVPRDASFTLKSLGNGTYTLTCTAVGKNGLTCTQNITATKAYAYLAQNVSTYGAERVYNLTPGVVYHVTITVSNSYPYVVLSTSSTTFYNSSGYIDRTVWDASKARNFQL